MTSSTLLGSEILQVQGVDGTGYPAATTQQTTTFNLGQATAFGATASAAGLTLTTSATQTAVPGLTVNLISGADYTFDIYLSVSASAGGGIAVNLGKGTATSATFTASGFVYNGATLAAQGDVTAQGTSLATLTGLANVVRIYGRIKATASGTFAVYAAQQTGGNASSTVINAGSWLNLQRIS